MNQCYSSGPKNDQGCFWKLYPPKTKMINIIHGRLVVRPRCCPLSDWNLMYISTTSLTSVRQILAKVSWRPILYREKTHGFISLQNLFLYIILLFLERFHPCENIVYIGNGNKLYKILIVNYYNSNLYIIIMNTSTDFGQVQTIIKNWVWITKAI